MNDRYRLMLPLAVPALAGLAQLAASGAPEHYLAVNAGALLLALFALPLLAGPDI